MNNKEQAQAMLRDFFRARKDAPWTADWFEWYTERDKSESGLYRGTMGPRACIERVGGMAGEW